MTEFVNTNFHRAYVDDPDEDSPALKRLGPGETISATGRFADRLNETPGVVASDSDEGKAYLDKDAAEIRALSLERPGDEAFPVPEDERQEERSGLHITGRDSGMPVASEEEGEVGDVKDGTGNDPHEGVAAVQDGEVERGDVPLASQDEETAPPVDHPEESTTVDEPEGPVGAAGQDLSELKVAELKELAEDRGVDVPSSGKDAIIEALEAAGEGRSGTVTTEDVPAAK